MWLMPMFVICLCGYVPAVVNGAQNAVTQFMGLERNSLCTILNLKTLVPLKVAVGTMFLRECA